MSSPMTGYTLDALRISMFNPCFNPPKGLFETDYPVGMLFAIVKDITGKYTLVNVPVNNNEEGQIHACEVMDSENFVCWAIDPWNSDINLDVE